MVIVTSHGTADMLFGYHEPFDETSMRLSLVVPPIVNVFVMPEPNVCVSLPSNVPSRRNAPSIVPVCVFENPPSEPAYVHVVVPYTTTPRARSIVSDVVPVQLIWFTMVEPTFSAV